MVKKLQKTSTDKKSPPQFSGAVKDSAQQIWLAGLGAFSKAQEEGSKVFETLVKEGLSIQRKTQVTAEEKIAEASARMASMATEIQSKAGSQWGKLENIFEERVAKAMGKLGVPSAKTVETLLARIEELEKKASVKATATPSAKTPAKEATKTPLTPAPARKTAVKPALKTAAAKKAQKPPAKKSSASSRKST